MGRVQKNSNQFCPKVSVDMWES